MMRRAAMLGSLSLLPAFAGGCGSSSDPDLGADGPAERARDVAQAVESGDSQGIDGLIEALDSDDPAERMLAIGALNRLTGRTFGYDFAGSRSQREAAIDRWVEWRRAERAGTTRTDLDAGTESPGADPTGDGA
ncbi:MAG: hypothetical protein ACTS27_09540 [Phycisphaerales bacterium]